MQTRRATRTSSGEGRPATAAPSSPPAQNLSLALVALAHDLRTPLTVIKGSAQLLARGIRSASADPTARAAGLTQIERAATRMSSMLDELRDLAQAAAGHRPVLDLRPTDLVAVAHRVAEEHRLLSGGRAITATAETAEVVGAWDEAGLARLLDNLVGNALAYSPAGTPVTVRVGRERGGWARLEVMDEEIGILAGDLPHIFEPLYRSANAAAQAGGTGIGLASARAMVERHGGSIDVTSKEGRGTAVTVRLPLARPTSADS